MEDGGWKIEDGRSRMNLRARYPRSSILYPPSSLSAPQYSHNVLLTE